MALQPPETNPMDSLDSTLMPRQRRAITFDVDPASLRRLREALTGWRIDVVYGATVASLPCDWNPGVVDAHVVGLRADLAETLDLCRFLTACVSGLQRSRQERQETEQAAGRHPTHPEWRGRMETPLFVLVPPGQWAVVGSLLEAGAHRCLLLPIEGSEVIELLAPIALSATP
jgi:hypothetical protein